MGGTSKSHDLKLESLEPERSALRGKPSDAEACSGLSEGSELSIDGGAGVPAPVQQREPCPKTPTLKAREPFPKTPTLKAQEPPPHYPKKPPRKNARPRPAHTTQPEEQPWAPSSKQTSTQTMPEHEHRVCKVNKDSMKTSGEATQCTELGRAKCKEQHSSGGCSAQDALKQCQPRLPEDDTTPPSNVNLFLKEEHSQAMQGCRSCTAIHEGARPHSLKIFLSSREFSCSKLFEACWRQHDTLHTACLLPHELLVRFKGGAAY